MTTDEEDGEINPIHTWAGSYTSPMVVPANSLYLNMRGDGAYAVGDPDQLKTEPEGRWYERPFFVVPRRIPVIPFGPLIDIRFVRMPNIKDDDWERLKNLLETEIPEKDRDSIDAACELLVNSVALKKQMAKWKQLRDQLKIIDKLAKTLLATLISTKPSAPENGALSAKQTIGTYIAMELTDPPYGPDRLSSDLSRLVAFTEATLEITKKGPGTKKQAELRFFLNTLSDVAKALGIPTKLLGHDKFAKVNPNDEIPPEKKIPPLFFRFVREVLLLTYVYGAPGILRAALPQEEKDAALKTLEGYTKKNDNALSKQLQRIRDDIQASQKPAAATGTAT